MSTILTFMIFGAVIGGLIGFGALVFTAWHAQNNPRDHDETVFESDQDVFAITANWAAANGYRLIHDSADSKHWQKGDGILTAPMFLEVHRNGNQYRMLGYVIVNALVMKGQMPLSGGGFVLKVPRGMAVKAQNQLLQQLGQPLLGA